MTFQTTSNKVSKFRKDSPEIVERRFAGTGHEEPIFLKKILKDIFFLNLNHVWHWLFDQ